MIKFLFMVLFLGFCAACGTDTMKKYDGASPDGPGPDGADGWDYNRDNTQPDNPYENVQPDLPDFSEQETCGGSEFNISRVIPDMLILLDRSNSMDDSPPTPPLWNTIRQAINTLTATTDTSIWYGLMAFPSSACAGFNFQCEAPPSTGVVVPVAEGNSMAIQNALMGLATCGGTPIALSLSSASLYLQTLADDHPKYILLATDGAPNCNAGLFYPCTCTGLSCDLNNENCLDDARTYGVLDGVCSAGVKTYVLGMGGAAQWTTVLQGMATHGCTDRYYAAQDPAEIQAALEEIAGDVASCAFEMDCSQIPDPDKVNFYFDDAVVYMDPTNTEGWNWTDPCDSETDTGTVEFFGAACQKIMNREVVKVSATFGCPSMII